MPLIQYKVRLGDDIFTESDYFPVLKKGQSADSLIQSVVIEPLNAKRKERGEEILQLVEVVIQDPFTHKHTWVKIETQRPQSRVLYECSHCRIIGYRKYHIVFGERGSLTRDEKYKSDRHYEMCKDKLRELPKKIVFK